MRIGAAQRIAHGLVLAARHRGGRQRRTRLARRQRGLQHLARGLQFVLQVAARDAVGQQTVMSPFAVLTATVAVAVRAEQGVEVAARAADGLGHRAVRGPAVAQVGLLVACGERGRSEAGVLEHDRRRLPVEFGRALRRRGFGLARRHAALDERPVHHPRPLAGVGIAHPRRGAAAGRIAVGGRLRERIARHRRRAQLEFQRDRGGLVVQFVGQCGRGAHDARTRVVEAIVAIVDRRLTMPAEPGAVGIEGPGPTFAVGLPVDAALVPLVGQLLAGERADRAADRAGEQQAGPGLDAGRRAGRKAHARARRAADGARAEVDQVRVGRGVVALRPQMLRFAPGLRRVVQIEREAGHAERGAGADPGGDADAMIQFGRLARGVLHTRHDAVLRTLGEQALGDVRAHARVLFERLRKLAMPPDLLPPAVAQLPGQARRLRARFARLLQRLPGGRGSVRLS